MASHLFVVDSSARRQQIKTTPGTHLRDVLEEACKKFGKDPEQFGLSDNGRPPKTLDLSLTVRHAGLSNAAKLQLIQASRTPSVISVALKLPAVLGGHRLQDKFASNTTLWLVLRKFEEAVAGGVTEKLNITQRGTPSTEAGSGRLEYEQPVVKIMQRELADLHSLQKTLAQLGYNSGSVLLQLEYKNSGVPMEEALARISQYFTTEGPRVTASSTGSSEPDLSRTQPAPVLAEASSAANVPAPSQLTDVPMTDLETSQDTETNSIPTAADAVEPVQNARDVVSDAQDLDLPHAPEQPGPPDTAKAQPELSVYKPPSSSTPLAARLPPSESDFIPTVEHAQVHQAVLNKAAQNRRLISDVEEAAESRRKTEALSSVISATIRVRFPDQMQVDLNINAEDTPVTLYEKVKTMLRDESLAFELRYTGPKGAPMVLDRQGKVSEQRLIRGLGWKGRVLVTMVWEASVLPEQRGQVLKEELVGRAKELSIPQPTAEAERGGRTTDQGKAEKPKEQKKGRGDVEAKMKKFLGFGKK